MESPRDEFTRSWQPRLWLTLATLILIGAYLTYNVSETWGVPFYVAMLVAMAGGAPRAEGGIGGRRGVGSDTSRAGQDGPR